MWKEIKRVLKLGAVVLFGSEPFSSALRLSNIKEYKYDWVWNKETARWHLVAKIRPMQQTENISVFGRSKTFSGIAKAIAEQYGKILLEEER